jgi:hypothetical protein
MTVLDIFYKGRRYINTDHAANAKAIPYTKDKTLNAIQYTNLKFARQVSFLKSGKKYTTGASIQIVTSIIQTLGVIHSSNWMNNEILDAKMKYITHTEGIDAIINLKC